MERGESFCSWNEAEQWSLKFCEMSECEMDNDETYLDCARILYIYNWFTSMH